MKSTSRQLSINSRVASFVYFRDARLLEYGNAQRGKHADQIFMQRYGIEMFLYGQGRGPGRRDTASVDTRAGKPYP